MVRKYSMMIGRFQPLHEGHKALIRKVLEEGRNVLVAMRITQKSKTDPYNICQRRNMFKSAFWKEIKENRIKVISIPDVEEVVYGRKVGWGMREIRLDEETEKISATEIRKKS